MIETFKHNLIITTSPTLQPSETQSILIAGSEDDIQKYTVQSLMMDIDDVTFINILPSQLKSDYIKAFIDRGVPVIFKTL